MIDVAQLMDEALSKCQTVTVDEAKEWLQNDNVCFVDVRDSSELKELGKIRNAEHLSRGMLEFLIDPNSPYHNQSFVPDEGDNATKKYVVYCMSGGRSALAAHTMKQMGYTNVYTLSGGFKSWCESQGAIEKVK